MRGLYLKQRELLKTTSLLSCLNIITEQDKIESIKESNMNQSASKKEKGKNRNKKPILITTVVLVMSVVLSIVGEYECKKAERMLTVAEPHPWSYEREKERLAKEVNGIYLRSAGFVLLSFSFLAILINLGNSVVRKKIESENAE